MRTLDHVTEQGVPETLTTFIRENCRISPTLVRWLPGSKLPERDRRLLDHASDMTSTLAAFHGSALHVEILQKLRLDDLYLREVFLRTKAETVVEYGIIAIALEQFSPEQQNVIQTGKLPLGAVLHRYDIPFVSAPIGFVSVPAEGLSETPLKLVAGSTCFGRFNRLTKPRGEPLAWILEILPLA
jgi:hypothetical protein